mgnify:CR=1 FL=1
MATATISLESSTSSPNTTWEYNIDKAKELLAGVPEAAGYKLLFQTSINSVRQKTQEIIKQSLEKVVFKVELKSIDASVYFSSDAGNPDTASHFYADFEMYTNGPSSPYPISYMASWKSTDPAVDIAQKSNAWAGTNATRFTSAEYNDLYAQAQVELDPAKQVELFHGMNDIVVNEIAEIPLVHRADIVADLVGRLRGHRLPGQPHRGRPGRTCQCAAPARLRRPGALRMPHRRGLRIAALRVRSAVGPCVGPGGR